jgi:hypothetical protein
MLLDVASRPTQYYSTRNDRAQAIFGCHMQIYLLDQGYKSSYCALRSEEQHKQSCCLVLFVAAVRYDCAICSHI